MKKQHAIRWIVAAAAAALPVVGISSIANAQLPAQNQDGHATDANNRVGSNGYNTPRSGGTAVTGNQIITRDVTGGKEFRGPIGYRDPGAFTGPIGGGLVEDFVKNSSGVPSQYGAPSDLTQPRPFYGDRRAIAPPTGSLPEGFNGGYVGSTLTSPMTMSNMLNTSPAAYGLQARTLNRDTLELNAQLNPGGYPGLAAPLDQAALTGMQTFNPNFAPSNWNIGQPGMNQQIIPGNLQAAPGQQPQAGAGDVAVQRMQQELQEAAGIRPQQNPASANGQPQQNQNPNNPSNNLSPVPPNSLNQPLNNSMQPGTPQPTDSYAQPDSAMSGRPLNSGLNSQQAYRDSMQAPASGLQSPQLAELQRRMDRYTSTTPSPGTPANAAGNALGGGVEIVAPANRPVSPAVGTIPGSTPAGSGISGSTPAGSGRLTPLAIPPTPSTPLVMHSLADGIKARGLHDLLATAEDNMRHDKFESAIEQYNQATRVASNNALIPLGRSIAELGAGFYAQADRDLRAVFRAAPELLGGRVELSAMYSPQRLDYLRKDLTSLTAADPKAQRPWFLLAFLAYNSGDSAEAQNDLSEAESRGSQLDWTIRRLKERWSFQPAAAKTEKPATPAPQPSAPDIQK